MFSEAGRLLIWGYPDALAIDILSDMADVSFTKYLPKNSRCFGNQYRLSGGIAGVTRPTGGVVGQAAFVRTTGY